MAYNKETGMYEGYIYKIYNDVNDKVYIGQTTTSIQIRWTQHLSKSAYREDNSIIHKAINKYGEEHFNIEVIEIICQDDFVMIREELNKREIFWIKQYNTISPNGYNMLCGGGYTPITSRKIYQFDLCGNYIQEFDSISNALRHLNESTKNVRIQRCIGKDNYAFGFLWSYYKDYNPYDLYIKNKKMRKSQDKNRIPVNKYDLDDNYKGSYISGTAAAKDLGRNHSGNITDCCRHKTKTAYGYKWYYAYDPNQPDKTKIIN